MTGVFNWLTGCSGRVFPRLYRAVTLALAAVWALQPVEAQDLRNHQLRHLTGHGMARKSIWAITQDTAGFMWFGTTNGLHRFDGRDLLIFKSEVRDTSSLPNLNIRTVLTDRSGSLWICTQGGGLSLFDPYTRTFSTFDPARTLAGSDIPRVFDFWSLVEGADGMLWMASMSGDAFYGFNRAARTFTRITVPSVTDKHFSHVTTVLESRQRQLWVGTLESGIARLERDGSIVSRFVHRPGDAATIPSNQVRVLYEDRTGTLWAGFWTGGLWKFDVSLQRFIPAAGYGATGPGGAGIYALASDGEGGIWVGTDQGVYVYDPVAGRIRAHIAPGPEDRNGLASGRVRSLFRDRSGIMWIGTEGGGVHRLVVRKKFRAIRPGPGSLNSDIIRGFLQVNEHQVWVATQGGGINLYDPVSDRITGTLRARGGQPGSLSEDRITTFMKDADEAVWIGTWGGGLNRYDPKTQRFSSFRYRENDSTSLSDDRIQLTFIDSRGRFWVGTENGLNLFNRTAGTFRRVIHDPSKPGTLSGNTIQTFGFLEDAGDHFWIGTWQGFNRYNAATNTAERFVYSPTDANTVSSNHITALYDDGAGSIWIATFGGGLNRFDKARQQFELFTEKDGLPHNLVFSILPDRRGNLWLSTSAGLSRFDPATRQFVNYYEEDGLQGNDFWWGAAYAAPDGRFYFGGTNGFTTFYPDSIASSTYRAPLAVTGIKTLERTLLPGPDGSITLDPSITSFTVEFASLDFSDPGRNQYAYRMEGIDPDWVYAGNRNTVSYAALKGGSYELLLKGSNSDGIWNDTPVRLVLHVRPPFWETGWFRITGILLLIGAVTGVMTRRNRQIERQKKLLAAEVERRTAEIERQNQTILENAAELTRTNEALRALNDEKNYLVSVVAHDLRNPLGSLRGYAETLREEDGLSGEERNRLLDAMASTARHGLDLIARILDVEVMEHRKPEYRLQAIDLSVFAAGAAAHMDRHAAGKRMRLDVITPEEPVFATADPHYLTLIAENLISNAVKYAPAGTRIQLSVHRNNGASCFTVTDEGPGIDPADLPKLFRKFQRLRNKPTGGESSVGLGLSIVKRFAEGMGGRVWCDSSPGKGASFTVALPPAAPGPV